MPKAFKPTFFQKVRWGISGRKGTGIFDLRLSSPAVINDDDKSCFEFNAPHKTLHFKAVSHASARIWVDEIHRWQELFASAKAAKKR